MAVERFIWLNIINKIRGSIIPAVFQRVLLCTFLGVIISVLHYYQFPINTPIFGFIPNLVIGLLLVFRTNTAYERFWEGRKLWGSLVNLTRNLARQMWVSIDEKTTLDNEKKVAHVRLLTAFALATKLHLREQKVNNELEALLPVEQYEKLKLMNNPPLEIAFWIGDYLQEQYDRSCLNSYQLAALQKLLDGMVDVLGGCERILRTPMPLAYAIHLRQLLFIYCILLPLEVVNKLTWWTGPVVGLVSFMLFGIEQIGVEIENPFGLDDNDLPLDAICRTINGNIEDLISLYPTVHEHCDSFVEISD